MCTNLVRYNQVLLSSSIKYRRGDFLKITTRGRYGLRAIVDIAARSNSLDEAGCVNLRSIAKSQGISENYLGQLVSSLKKADLIKSVRGAKGGYVISRPADEISVWDILIALEGEPDSVDCKSTVSGGAKFCSGENCKNNCVARLVWNRFHDRIKEEANSIKLSELVRGYRYTE